MRIYSANGALTFQVCLPLVPNSPRQLQLDNELNAIMTSNWDNWMHSAYTFIHHRLHQLGDITDAAFNLTKHLRIQYPRNLVSALLTHCSPPWGNESFFKAIALKVELNFSGLLAIPVVRKRSEDLKTYLIDQAVLMMSKKLDAGLLPPNFELLLQNLIAQTPASTSPSGQSGSAAVLATANRFWMQAIGGAAEREKAMQSSVTNLQRYRHVLKQVVSLRRDLEKELSRAPNVSTSCSTRLSQSLRISNYGLRLMRSTGRSMRLRDHLESLNDAATTLRRISKQPTFTGSLSNFAQMAYSMGLSKASTNVSRDGLLQCVNRSIGLEYERLASAFESHYAAKSVNAWIAATLNHFTAPCQRLGAIAWDVVGTTCVIPLPRPQNQFIPIVQRVAAVGFIILLFVSLYSCLCIIYTCVTRSFSHRAA
ncbi:hypothetical protein TcWFU_007844 [Taenia crassiceps]|uniref:Uncharacterized protein n=1 Tax=Taenia crassiceps TaxID=6207 RepID=A0ABR4Q9G9_9CEST